MANKKDQVKPVKSVAKREEAQFAKEVAEVKASRKNKDMKDLIGLILESPVNSSDAEYAEVDGNYSMTSFKDRNTDVRTRLLIAISIKAMAGDLKAAEFLMKYGGFEPPKEHQVEVRTPIFINDLDDDDE